MGWWKGCLAGVLVGFTSIAGAITPVEEHGALKVSRNQILDAQGQPTQLVGMSLFWSGWASQFYNRRTIHWLAYDWKVSVVRCAMGVEGGGNYLDTNNGAAKNMRMVDSVVKAAIDLGIYVILDWHDHNAPNHQEQSIDFFQKMARKWGSYPNVIYEIYNEPHGVMQADANGNGGEDAWSWSDSIKPYSQAVVDSIRAIDPDNLILIGNENWDQNPSGAAADPVKGTNLSYTLHFYAGSHVVTLSGAATGSSTGAYISGRNALAKGSSIFISEWGVTNADGGNVDKKLYLAKAQEWLDWAKLNSVSWCNWSVVNKNEASAALKPTANPLGGWNDTDLSPAGTWVRSKIQEANAKYTFPEPTPIPPRVPDSTTLPGRIQAEGWSAFQGVQFESSSDEDGSEDMGWVEAGDWADYIVRVPQAGKYNLHVRAASRTEGGEFVLQDAAGNELKRLAVAGTGGWQTWVTVDDTTGVDLPQGTQKIRVLFAGGAGSLFNLNWFELDHQAVPLRSPSVWRRGPSLTQGSGSLVVEQAEEFRTAILRSVEGKVLDRAAVVAGTAKLTMGSARGVLVLELVGSRTRELRTVIRAR